MDNNTFGLTINDKIELALDQDTMAKMDIIPLGNSKLHLLRNGCSYVAEIIEINREKKVVVLKVGQEEFKVKIADSYDQLVEQMGLDINIAHKINEIKAPMPGLVLSIDVTEGQSVVQGDPLVVLEAMKMENVIKSPGEGIVKAILAQKGKPVEKGEVLIEME